MSNPNNPKPAAPSKLMHYGMVICCTVMLLPIALFFLAGGSIVGLWANLGLVAPIALCVGIHVVMFKMMGKSCHGSKDKTASAKTTETGFDQVQVSEIAR